MNKIRLLEYFLDFLLCYNYLLEFTEAAFTKKLEKLYKLFNGYNYHVFPWTPIQILYFFLSKETLIVRFSKFFLLLTHLIILFT
jgi:hypothetical protein